MQWQNQTKPKPRYSQLLQVSQPPDDGAQVFHPILLPAYTTCWQSMTGHFISFRAPGISWA